MKNKVTESASHYRHLEKMSTADLLHNINREDQKVSIAVYRCIPAIEALVDAAYDKMKEGGRLFYIGAGTSGRLGILDASECPPTFGVPFDWVIGLMAGGDSAIRKAVEFAEDDVNLAWKDLSEYDISNLDFVIGIAASGSTPYVIHGLKKCRESQILTGCITCNPRADIIDHSDFPVVAVVGPEFVTGSTRMKSGTAQKLILNMISTSIMIKLGRVYDNRMVDMQLSNNKLFARGVEMIRTHVAVSIEEAQVLLKEKGSVREVLSFLNYWK